MSVEQFRGILEVFKEVNLGIDQSEESMQRLTDVYMQMSKEIYDNLVEIIRADVQNMKDQIKFELQMEAAFSAQEPEQQPVPIGGMESVDFLPPESASITITDLCPIQSETVDPSLLSNPLFMRIQSNLDKFSSDEGVYTDKDFDVELDPAVSTAILSMENKLREEEEERERQLREDADQLADFESRLEDAVGW